MIHQYQNNGYNIVLDVNSGCVHVVDEPGYEVIACLNRMNENQTVQTLKEESTWNQLKDELEGKYSEEELRDILDDVTELTANGQLFVVDTYEPFIGEVIKRKTVVKALCLHIAHDCNLACKYCFAEEGEYHGRRALMTYEVGKKALDFLIANSGTRRNLEVDFFGGEPLMNWQVVKDLVAYGREQEKLHNKKFRFTLTTNGVLLNDEVMEFCNKEMGNVVLSVDGRKEVHDYMRPDVDGHGTYDKVVKNFKKLVDSRDGNNYYLRGTFTNRNMDFSKDVLSMADEGFDILSVEPVVLKDSPYGFTKEDLPKIFAEYDKLTEIYLKRKKEGKGFFFFHFNIDLEHGPCVAKRLSGCGAGHEYYAVAADGNMYPCHQFAGRENYMLGNVFEGVKNKELPKEFRKTHVLSKEKCRDCWAKFFCSGGCHANADLFHGNIHEPYELGCELQKKRCECAIVVKTAEKFGL